MLETGNPFLATQIAGDWVFWRTGNVDLFDAIAQLPRALLILAVGAVLIIAAGFFTAWRLRRRAGRLAA